MNRGHVRQATKRGGIHPPRTTINRVGEYSSAMRRQQDRIHDKEILAGYVQLKPGTLVIWDRQPHRIVELAELPLDLWGEKHEMRYATALTQWETGGKRGDRPEKATWDGRPFAFILQPDGKPHEKPLHLIGPANHSWDVLPEHYAICSACGELPPCRHELNEREADQQAAKADVLMDIPPGHCLGCGDSWSCGEMLDRPFKRAWRKEATAGAKRAWDEAGRHTRAEYEQWLADELAAVMADYGSAIEDVQLPSPA